MRNWKRMRDMMGVHLGLLPGQLIRGCMSEPDGWLEKQYEAHNQLVEDTVPKDKLLVFNVKEGWGPVCQFLGKEVPQESFPNVNESKELQRATTIMRVVSYGWLPLFLGSMGCLSGPSLLNNISEVEIMQYFVCSVLTEFLIYIYDHAYYCGGS